jgi:hypothetical protein
MEEQGKHEHSLPHEISSEQKRINEAAQMRQSMILMKILMVYFITFTCHQWLLLIDN